MEKRRIAFHTFGCKLNFAETSSIARKFTEELYNTVDFKEKADIYVIHSCTVTAQAEKKCKAAIRQAMRRNPEASVAVIGCYSQLKPEELLKMPGVNIVLGNSEKFKLFDVIDNKNRAPDNSSSENLYTSGPGTGNILEIDSTDKFSATNFMQSRTYEPGYSMNDRTRSFFKVQDGCDYFCTYCAIPFARGRSRSATIKETMDIARQIASTDIREIVLTGVNIGDFGRQHNESFSDLVRELDNLDGIDRIRISSIEPELLRDEIIELVSASGRLMPHFHIPLQSGTDRILALMRRKYKREVFEARVKKIKSLMPDACIAADVITGFPGETKEDFIDTVNFIKSVEISYLHVFTYSSRPGTKSAEMDGQVSESEKSERSRVLHELSEIKKHEFYQKNIGTIQEVLWESDAENGYMFGFTGNYIRCKRPFHPEKINVIERLRLEQIDKDGVFIVSSDIA
ncbi:MAG TPA: tRNA (N(6)-L-threonylcarbamoyladenosine(37)-C(2))-methylthiotransferase MtaB [Lentimicrobium sp.]|nr:tRNA (N(6)-L-threonylcarbamoyladenosine(37)-C(2))-methylthiotransferase MtaB [Lentimicrobium sp.]